MSPNWCMAVGGALWLTGELWGVKRNSGPNAKGKNDTTSEWVWWLEKRVPAVTLLLTPFLISLVAHLSPAHTPLVP